MMRSGGDRDHMRVWPEQAFTDLGDLRAFDTEDRDNARFPGHIEPALCRIEREDVWVFADAERLDDAPSSHIKNEQRVVALTGDKGKPIRRIDQASMIVIRSPLDGATGRLMTNARRAKSESGRFANATLSALHP